MIQKGELFYEKFLFPKMTLKIYASKLVFNKIYLLSISCKILISFTN